MQLFSADATMFSNFFFFFLPAKVVHNRPKTFLPQPSPSHSQQPKIDFSYHKNVPPTICSLICAKKPSRNHFNVILMTEKTTKFLQDIHFVIGLNNSM